MSDDATVVLRLNKADAGLLDSLVANGIEYLVKRGFNGSRNMGDYRRIAAVLQAALAAPAADAGTGDSLEKAIAECEWLAPTWRIFKMTAEPARYEATIWADFLGNGDPCDVDGEPCETMAGAIRSAYAVALEGVIDEELADMRAIAAMSRAGSQADGGGTPE